MARTQINPDLAARRDILSLRERVTSYLWANNIVWRHLSSHMKMLL